MKWNEKFCKKQTYTNWKNRKINLGVGEQDMNLAKIYKIAINFVIIYAHFE